ncbi:contactin-3 [Platysternon megacephalum]|uniref:Contactin-3 n=1 Tax=Platysternon megacephalum TaxID=55544 RepID=A0A4D9EN22_9SAUR|nr:contactin-3 [Platysternon megacephalum]
MLFRNTLLAKLVRFTCLSPPFITKDDFVYKHDAQVFITSSLLLLYKFLNHLACNTDIPPLLPRRLWATNLDGFTPAMNLAFALKAWCVLEVRFRSRTVEKHTILFPCRYLNS